MLSIEGEVTKAGEIQTRGNFTFRNIEVYYGNAENPIFCLKKPLCNDCDLQVGDQVRIDFEIKAPKGYNNLYVVKYHKLNNTAPCSPKTIGNPCSPLITINERLNSEQTQNTENQSINEDNGTYDETERVLDMIFDSPQGKEASSKEAQRQAAIAMVSIMPPKRQTQNEAEGDKRTPAVYDHELNTKSIADNPDNDLVNNLCQCGEVARSNQETEKVYTINGQDIPYSDIVWALAKEIEKDEGAIQAGVNRHNYHIAWCNYLRYICENNPDKLVRIVPNLMEEEDPEAKDLRRAAEDMCAYAPWKKMPKELKMPFSRCKTRCNPKSSLFRL